MSLPITVFDSLPAPWPQPMRERLLRLWEQNPRQRVVVLDDDPTGTQTVHGIPILTTFDEEEIRQALAEQDNRLLFILTNSRSLLPEQAQQLYRTLGERLRRVAEDLGLELTLVSRSDSTLRGHYPIETDALAATAYRGENPPLLLVPAFFEGGRYTIDNVHYVLELELLIPAGETEFAHDPSFSFNASNLREWVEEKTQGRIKWDQVLSLSLDEIRIGGPEAVQRRLATLEAGDVLIVNAAAQRDLEVVALAVMEASATGSRFLFRSAASILPALIGQETGLRLRLPEAVGKGGLIVCGSYVGKTTRQVESLLQRFPNVQPVVVDVPKLLEAGDPEQIYDECAKAIEERLERDEPALLLTSRKVVTGQDSAASRAVGAKVASALVQIVRRVQVRPRYFLSKGGITSHDMAEKALDVRKALVLGPLLPGVPMWQLDESSRWPGIPFVVFPGNVGGPDALADAVAQLQGSHTSLDS